MCCTSKKKPSEQPVPKKDTPQYGNYFGKDPKNSSIAESNANLSSKPKSLVQFNAQDFDSAPLNNQSVYVATQKVTHYVHDRGDRMEDYANEVNTANKSKMIMENTILKQIISLYQL